MMDKEQEAMEVGLPATARWRGRGCGGWFTHRGGVGGARGRWLYAGENAAEAQDGRASEVGCRRPPVEVRERVVEVVFSRRLRGGGSASGAAEEKVRRRPSSASTSAARRPTSATRWTLLRIPLQPPLAKSQAALRSQRLQALLKIQRLAVHGDSASVYLQDHAPAPDRRLNSQGPTLPQSSCRRPAGHGLLPTATSRLPLHQRLGRLSPLVGASPSSSLTLVSGAWLPQQLHHRPGPTIKKVPLSGK